MNFGNETKTNKIYFFRVYESELTQQQDCIFSLVGLNMLGMETKLSHVLSVISFVYENSLFAMEIFRFPYGSNGNGYCGPDVVVAVVATAVETAR